MKKEMMQVVLGLVGGRVLRRYLMDAQIKDAELYQTGAAVLVATGTIKGKYAPAIFGVGLSGVADVADKHVVPTVFGNG